MRGAGKPAPLWARKAVKARRGAARLGVAVVVGSGVDGGVRRGAARRSWYGSAGYGLVGPDEAVGVRRGAARSGRAWRSRFGSARLVAERLGGRGGARSGTAR